MEPPINRRQFLQRSALVGLAATAGCVSGSTTGNPGTATDGESPTSEPTTSSGELTPPDNLDAWLEDANGYDGEPTTYGVDAQPSINVGEPFNDTMAFYPAVIEIAPMTPVRWEWTGHGGQHNVVALDGTFDSGRTNAQSGTCYHYVFDETGEYPFVSEPRRDSGMKGAIIVREPPSTGNEAVDQWMSNAGSFDGTVVDRTDTATTTVRVGTEGNQGDFAFDPPVLHVSTDTTVVWEWTGDGGAHNVSFEDIDVESGDPAAEAGTTFEHAFAESGTYLYACLPHQSLGMKGAIIVE
jgi:halocyanin-like protein